MKNWKYAFYRQKGINHGVCQDFVDVYADDTRIIACLCDGLGSLKNSDVAAQETVKNVIGLFRAVPNAPKPQTDLAPFRRKLIAELQRRLKAVAAERDLALDSMDCTLLFVCLFLEQKMAMIGSLGDSALCVIRDDRPPELFCDSDFIGTRAVLDNDAAEHLQCTAFPLDDHVRSILLTSDGLENEIYYKGLTHVAKNTELYLNAMLRDEPEKIMQKRIRELTSAEDTVFDDDISIAVLSCLDCPIRLEDEPTWPCLCGAKNLLVDTFCSECSRDFLDLYKNIDFRGDRAGFFRYIRRSPKAKQELMAAIAGNDSADSSEMLSRPAQPQEQATTDHMAEHAAPGQTEQLRPTADHASEQTEPLRPTANHAAEQTEQLHPTADHVQESSAPPQHQQAPSAKKNNTVMLAIAVAAIVVCAALMTMLLMVLIHNAQEEPPKPVPAVTTTVKPSKPPKHHGGSTPENSETGETAPSGEQPIEGEQPTEGEQSTGSEQPMPSTEPDRPYESVAPSENVDSGETSLPESFIKNILPGADGAYPGIDALDDDYTNGAFEP